MLRVAGPRGRALIGEKPEPNDDYKIIIERAEKPAPFLLPVYAGGEPSRRIGVVVRIDDQSFLAFSPEADLIGDFGSRDDAARALPLP